MSKEKRCMLSELIALAQADHKIDDREYHFIVTVAESFGFDKNTVDALVENPEKTTPLKTEVDRISHFYRLILLMNVDDETHVIEIDAIRNFGLKMGIRPEAVEQILREMWHYENKMIPTEKLTSIFKRFYN
ncbi:TerB family tellurite resistance protein [Dokdonia sinensis]|uniref:TerB family tellurite resistance protein n=1 Tax=Dokdonia sinensis TaxID=2479847 RepID=A0A3M0FUZ7_9FLAO|nr:TerB family tellurite resistance protein [Dokdonia sinensis]RMB56328.1 TerB family tellurite resistance protein [Dokdonia sinensis]